MNHLSPVRGPTLTPVPSDRHDPRKSGEVDSPPECLLSDRAPRWTEQAEITATSRLGLSRQLTSWDTFPGTFPCLKDDMGIGLPALSAYHLGAEQGDGTGAEFTVDPSRSSSFSDPSPSLLPSHAGCVCGGGGGGVSELPPWRKHKCPSLSRTCIFRPDPTRNPCRSWGKPEGRCSASEHL